jgi:hypothetical protein
MRIIALKCSQCSGPLDVPADREQITCIWCRSILHVSQLKQATPSSPGPDNGPLQAELEKLDAEWEEYRRIYLERDDAGEYVVPESEACRMGAWVTGGIGVILAIGGLASGNWGFVILSIVIAGVVIAVLLRQAKIGEVYQRSLDNYRRARQEILDRMPQAS